MVQLPNTTSTDIRPQLKITKCRRAGESWIVFENANCDNVPGNMVFRHPRQANYGYLDGRVDNLTTGDVDGASITPSNTAASASTRGRAW